MSITVQRILQLASQKNIRDQELCRLLNAKKDKIYTWKTNRSTPTTNEIAVLAGYFNVSTDYLLGKTDSPNSTGEAKSPAPMSDRGKVLLDRIMSMSPENQAKVNEYLDFLLDRQRKEKHQ